MSYTSAITIDVPRGHRPKRGIAHRRELKRWQAWREENPLVIDGVEVPEEVIDDGRCAAFVLTMLRLGDVDSPRCPTCGRVRELYQERCSCGALKPWVYPHELEGRVRARVLNQLS